MPPPCPRHALLGAQRNDERPDLRLNSPRAGRAETDDIFALRAGFLARVFFLCNLCVLLFSIYSDSESDNSFHD